MVYFGCLTNQALLALFDAFCEYNEDFGAAMCEHICHRADMSEEWLEALDAGDFIDLERVVYNAIDKLKES